MFFGGPPPPPSPQQVRVQEAMAKSTIQFAVTTCVLLYLSPFAIDYVSKLL